ncbi:hypothetical protein A3I56_00085 [Candidatus Roizmanbacteria bacterium RIFCSPLOWO2_02_FULL_43_10]|uniref:DUF916 domain-containing protein n=1 Tax=Candidatus Roizmanbacteria bacterium RIFCSPLOWO2_02_FULL_43_10 TaxID=1802078 RepID=A0A1F7JVE6_9BACT|nr:MAG: hypothetical protein A3I56_00085 [Candidatus Roizmanbacteria bacterium RIFCSPLOWO2_02_FULL_43_10]
MRKLGATIIAVFTALALVSVVAGSVRAQSILRLQVSPPRQEVAIDPGKKTAVDLKFYNLTDEHLAGTLKVADFIVEDNKGTPRILDSSTQLSPRFSGAQWITLPQEKVVIPADDVLPIQARIAVPADARPGGRYVAVYFEPASQIAQQEAAGSPEEVRAQIASRIAGLVYIRVNGPITEKALISNIFAPTFLEYGPITVEAEILNRSDFHIRPLGSVTLRNMLGGLVDQKKLDQINIFPDTAREYASLVGNKWMFGRYTASVIASYGGTGQVVERSISIWVFPWKVALIILLALIIIILIGKYGYKRIITRQRTLEKEVEQLKEEVEQS